MALGPAPATPSAPEHPMYDGVPYSLCVTWGPTARRTVITGRQAPIALSAVFPLTLMIRPSPFHGCFKSLDSSALLTQFRVAFSIL